MPARKATEAVLCSCVPSCAAGGVFGGVANAAWGSFPGRGCGSASGPDPGSGPARLPVPARVPARPGFRPDPGSGPGPGSRPGSGSAPSVPPPVHARGANASHRTVTSPCRHRTGPSDTGQSAVRSRTARIQRWRAPYEA